MREADVVVVGAGLAGLHTGRLLARRAWTCWWSSGAGRCLRRIRATGIFVRRTLADFDVPEHLLGPAVGDLLPRCGSRRPGHPPHSVTSALSHYAPNAANPCAGQ